MNSTTRAQEVFRQHRESAMRGTDRLFLWLLLGQWLFAVVYALVMSPDTWAGTTRTIHPHVVLALALGLAINVLPVALILTRPGTPLTRHVVAVAQMLWSALLIHLSGGRIETHFHIFGSLAFIAFYRDWRVLITASLVVATDHFLRGMFWPESVYGIANPEWWRFLEHAFWVVFEDVVLLLACHRGNVELLAIAEREASLEKINAAVELQVQNRTEQLERSLSRYRSLVESTSAVTWEVDAATLKPCYVSPNIADVFGFRADLVMARNDPWEFLHDQDRPRVRESLQALARGAVGSGSTVSHRLVDRDGHVRHVRSDVRLAGDDAVRRLVGVTLDVTAQKTLEYELHQAQKLESVGRLAAGVAHEINTPIQFVSDNVRFLRDATRDLFTVVEDLTQTNAAVLQGTATRDAAETAAVKLAMVDMEFLRTDVPAAIDSSLDGLRRVAEIVRSMRSFAHPGHGDIQAVDLNQAIQATLAIAKNEYRYIADLATDYGELPPVTCDIGGINQVVLNIVVNAAHAIADVVGDSGDLGLITVTTRREGDRAVIAITDTGGGIPDSVRDRIFDPFFTTKEVGRGTGQGLAIAHTVVVDKHAGSIAVETAAGVGTTFTVSLPVNYRDEPAEALDPENERMHVA